MRKIFHECHLDEVLSIIHFPKFYSGEKVFDCLIVDSWHCHQTINIIQAVAVYYFTAIVSHDCCIGPFIYCIFLISIRQAADLLQSVKGTIWINRQVGFRKTSFSVVLSVIMNIVDCNIPVYDFMVYLKKSVFCDFQKYFLLIFFVA